MFAPLAVRDFRLLFLGLLLGQALTPFQFVAQIIWVQVSAPEDLRIVLVGLIAAVRGAGMLSFGLFGGALADRFDRRRLLIVTQLAALVCNVAIGVVMVLGSPEGGTLVLFYVLTFGASALMSIDLPTRQAIVPDIVGRELTTAGIALNAAGGQIALPVAIMGTGFVIDAFGAGRGLSRGIRGARRAAGDADVHADSHPARGVGRVASRHRAARRPGGHRVHAPRAGGPLGGRALDRHDGIRLPGGRKPWPNLDHHRGRRSDTGFRTGGGHLGRRSAVGVDDLGPLFALSAQGTHRGRRGAGVRGVVPRVRRRPHGGQCSDRQLRPRRLDGERADRGDGADSVDRARRGPGPG